MMTILDIFIYSIVKNMTRVLFSRILRALIPYLHFSQFNNVILRKYGIGLIHSHLPFIRLQLSSCYILHNTLQIIFIQLHPGFSSRWIKIRFRFKFQSISWIVLWISFDITSNWSICSLFISMSYRRNSLNPIYSEIYSRLRNWWSLKLS